MRLAREYLRRPLGVIAAAFLVLVALAVIAAPLIAPYDQLRMDLGHSLALPSAKHWLGTDRLGRDVLSRLLWGGRVSLGGLAEALSVAFAIGVVAGLIAGYVGRGVDNAISRTTEVLMATPGIVVLLMVYGISNNNAHLGMITLGVLCSPSITRVTRAAARAVSQEVYISSAEVLGMGRLRIVFDHVLPNIWGPIIVSTAVLGAVILGIQGGLNYINLGVNPPAASWGGMVSDGQRVLAQQPWLIVPSGLLLTLVIMALMLTADGLRDATASNRSRPARAQAAAARKPSAQAGAGQADASAALSVRGLSVSFSGLEVVRNVSFDVRDGRTLGIVGESGCGKSVTASAALDQLGPGSRIDGEVVFGGVDLNHAPRRVRARTRGAGIAYVSQDPMVALDPCFTVESQLGELIGRHERLRGSRRRARALELLRQVGLPNPADTAARYPHQLSGGMAQRVSIACALAGRPRVLIADEPTTALDVTIQGEILDLLRTLQGETGLAIVLITHDLGVVADLCDRVAVMYAGEIVEIADVESIFDRPAHPYTRGLIDSNPIASKRGSPLPSIPGAVPSPANWPIGCHFGERCRFRTPQCSAGPVPLAPVADASPHQARCIRVGELDLASAGQERRS
ncbi:peptide/nickel transport system permease protein [Roseiarcus fermentans]|uniref:Peptide/nickel transport system permease protein n=1 Tax=Roseiarcus fermentans TaxID=1473586 RepID=A0A366FI32_9HYPH|nr:dipeptide/oligopeptide/nickel ABC transporter permease/ATP-binding protein [Roseiarcus fermentans]RBP14318.1 peptide/nickel transport system permease protein [Roseiarcus fermentans]